MHLIQITASQGTLNQIDQDALVSRVSDAVLKAERAPVTDPGAQVLAWATYQELPEAAVCVGGQVLEQPPLRVNITTPQGALDTTTRAELAAEVGEIVDDFIGVFEGRLNHWIMLHEVAEGSWGGAGQIFPLAGIQEAMNIKPVNPKPMTAKAA
jgi:phenylpyruvate tautomerase PptA (4-oxalocrotonate tautomerase family)